MFNKVKKGDALNIINKFEDETFDLVVADPPYNISIDIWDTFNSKEEYFAFMEEWIKSIYVKMKENSSIYIYNNEYNSALTIPILEKYGFVFKNWITWVKRDGMTSAKKRYVNSQEIILFFTKGEPVFNFDEVRTPYLNESRMKHAEKKGILKNGKRWFPNPNGKLRTNVWDDISHRQTTKVNGKVQKGEHPTMKPISQIETIIKASSNEGDLVLDLFSGSGTTSIASKKNNRNSIAIEKEEKYVSLIRRRLSNVK